MAYTYSRFTELAISTTHPCHTPIEGQELTSKLEANIN